MSGPGSYEVIAFALGAGTLGPGDLLCAILASATPAPSCSAQSCCTSQTFFFLSLFTFSCHLAKGIIIPYIAPSTKIYFSTFYQIVVHLNSFLEDRM